MSIVEIAKQAGVSISTVSRYFNQPDKVSHDAAGRIRAVTTRLNYQPDIRRPGPKTSERVGIKTGTIAFLSLGDYAPEKMLKMPAFPVLLGSIQRTLIERQLSLLLAHLDPGSGNIPGCIDPRFCDGVILFGRDDRPGLKEKLVRKLGSTAMKSAVSTTFSMTTARSGRSRRNIWPAGDTGKQRSSTPIRRMGRSPSACRLSANGPKNSEWKCVNSSPPAGGATSTGIANWQMLSGRRGPV